MNRVWSVEYCYPLSHTTTTELFKAEKEAREFYEALPYDWFKTITMLNDIWGWSEKHIDK